MPREEYSADTQAVWEVPAKNLGNLILNPSTKFPSLLLGCSPRQRTEKKAFRGLDWGWVKACSTGGGMEWGHWQLLGKKGCKGCYKLLGTIPCLCFRKTPRGGDLRLNQDPEDLDVPVVTAYIMEILLIILAWRIIMTWSRFSHKPYSFTFFLAGNFKVVMQQLGIGCRPIIFW